PTPHTATSTPSSTASAATRWTRRRSRACRLACRSSTSGWAAMGDPKANNVWVEALGSALLRGGAALENVPGLLKRILREEAWREFQPKIGPVVRHERFADFVTTPPVQGLGASVEL